MYGKIGGFIFNVSMVFASIWIVNEFWSTFYKRKNAHYFLVWIAFALIQFFFETNRGDINFFVTVVNIIMFLLIVSCGYHSTGKEKYFLLTMFYASWSLIEMFVFFLIAGISLEKERIDMIGGAISKIIMIIVVHFFSIKLKKKDKNCVPNKFYFLLLLIPFGSICIAINQFFSKGNTYFSLFTISILIIFNIIVFELYNKLYEVFINEKEIIVCAQQFDLIAKNTEAQKRMMNEFREEKHNMINELIALKNCVENCDMETTIKNINQIIKNCNSIEHFSDSGNTTIDALINFKYEIAKEYNIEFQLNVFVPDELPIEQYDIGVVLGNALDNAIEATKACIDKKRYIQILIELKNESLVMMIKNPYQHKLRRDGDGNLLTTKNDNSVHGYGINSIKKISEKYQGDVIIDESYDVFMLLVTMNLG